MRRVTLDLDIEVLQNALAKPGTAQWQKGPPPCTSAIHHSETEMTVVISNQTH